MNKIENIKVVAKLPQKAASAAVIEQALRIMQRKNAWAKDDLAYTTDGQLIVTDEASLEKYGQWATVIDPSAAQFCALGMLGRARAELGMPLASILPEEMFINKMMEKEPVSVETDGEPYPYESLVDFNDAFYTKKKDVTAVFRKALKKLQEVK